MIILSFNDQDSFHRLKMSNHSLAARASDLQFFTQERGYNNARTEFYSKKSSRNYCTSEDPNGRYYLIHFFSLPESQPVWPREMA